MKKERGGGIVTNRDDSGKSTAVSGFDTEVTDRLIPTMGAY